ncbi:MAG: hypothetical protein A2Y20_07955 [Firmicutes bacterium GWF2_51_9]|nr:MAG: hypothetical protein A2Y20_07955 [Firmicutes bacterium GWF2_51_9]OGS58643.1 MAG: hypothetical protein A2Y19_03690 [Firmicutes bacterium GWE2_51_13]HAM63656.1 hypothetical protein [Erysipelotrichaceae bacterium]HBZ40406.1 hypothetical protein [Erysipelotrichaceae bacterium]
MNEASMNFEFSSIPVELIWRNCILDTVVHALQNCIYPYFDYEKSWSNSNFSINNSEGVRATITFYNNVVLIGIRDESLENHFGFSDDNDLVRNAPDMIKRIANDYTLQYLLVDENNKTLPAITAFLWITDAKAVSKQKLSDLLVSGYKSISYIFLSIDELIEYWRERYEFSDKQIDLVFEIYDIFMRKPNLTVSFSSVLIQNKFGYVVTKECKETFSEIGILLE